MVTHRPPRAGHSSESSTRTESQRHRYPISFAFLGAAARTRGQKDGREVDGNAMSPSTNLAMSSSYGSRRIFCRTSSTSADLVKRATTGSSAFRILKAWATVVTSAKSASGESPHPPQEGGMKTTSLLARWSKLSQFLTVRRRIRSASFNGIFMTSRLLSKKLRRGNKNVEKRRVNRPDVGD